MGRGAKAILTYFTLSTVGVYFFFWGLVQARAFLAPLSIAVLLAMVIVPVARWLEGRGLSRAWAALLSDLVIILFFVLLGWVLSSQVTTLAQDWPKMRARIEPKVQQVQQFIHDNLGAAALGQEASGQSQNAPPPSPGGQGQNSGASQRQSQQSPSLFGQGSPVSGSSIVSSAGSYAVNIISFLGTFLLIFVYIFFFLLYRSKFRKSAIKMVPEEKREKAQKLITQSLLVSQNYLFGRLILIVILAVFYAIGLSISGVQHAILISILAAVLTLIPYIGNIVGYGLAVGMAFFSGSSLTGAIGVTVTFAVAQFVESYILEPYIVGEKVNINPVFTIIVVVLGGAVWGVVGMLIAIPALGIVKVIFDHIPPLRPLGYLFGGEDVGDDNDSANVFDKAVQWVKEKFSS